MKVETCPCCKGSPFSAEVSFWVGHGGPDYEPRPTGRTKTCTFCNGTGVHPNAEKPATA